MLNHPLHRTGVSRNPRIALLVSNATYDRKLERFVVPGEYPELAD
jgi:hypothetical protein